MERFHTTLGLLSQWGGTLPLRGNTAQPLDMQIPLTAVLESQGLSETLWTLRATTEDFEAVVRPWLRGLMGRYLEHLALGGGMPDEARALLSQGAGLLQDPHVSAASLEAFADAARQTPRASAATTEAEIAWHKATEAAVAATTAGRVTSHWPTKARREASFWAGEAARAAVAAARAAGGEAAGAAEAEWQRNALRAAL